MPISRDSFERGSILPRAEVLAFLEAHNENAYTIDEIYRETRTTLEYSVEQLEEVLRSLVEDGWVQSKEIEGIVYYRATPRRIGFRR